MTHLDPAPQSRTVYVSIGNSDGKLTPRRWAHFWHETNGWLTDYAEKIHGQWHSLPTMVWVNACWCVEVTDDQAEDIKIGLEALAKKYDQDSIAYALAETEFLTP
jgi:hypothetical protein